MIIAVDQTKPAQILHGLGFDAAQRAATKQTREGLFRRPAEVGPVQQVQLLLAARGGAFARGRRAPVVGQVMNGHDAKSTQLIQGYCDRAGLRALEAMS